MSSATHFFGQSDGLWKIDSMQTINTSPLPLAERLLITDQPNNEMADGWHLRGVKSNIRYTTRPEKKQLEEKFAPLNNPVNTCAALIPIKKSEEWWQLTQDERRKIFEEDSHHTKIGLKYMPAIARQLYHSRDLGEPFDFLTWFEFAPIHKNYFDELVNALRETEEWRHVVSEIDLRLSMTK